MDEDEHKKGDVAMLKVGMLSGWHVHAKGYANELKGMDDVDIVGVYDELPDRGRAWAEELDVPFHGELEDFLAEEAMDGVVVNAPTDRHAEVMVMSAKAGKHLFTEKVMALTVAECGRIASAVQEADVKFCISFPARTTPEHLFAKKVAEEGMIGEVTLMRVRTAHNGASADWLPPHFYDPKACGGGAMMDLGAHPMYLARWILGKPKCIASTFNDRTDHPVEDNAVSVIEFENKAIGVVETSFVSSHSPGVLELYGTEGALFIGGAWGGIRMISNSVKTDVPGWVTPTRLPERLPKPIRMWVDGIVKDAPIPFGVEEGTQLTELMEYAYLSHREGRQVEIPSR